MNDPMQTVDEPERQPDAPIPAESTPQYIGRYRIEKILGQGGFGLVYLAYDDQLERHLAIKVPHRHRVSNSEDAQAYLIEARIVAKLDHPNIVPVHDVGSTDDCPFFVVSKFIEGSTLAQRIKSNRPSVAEVTDLVATVAETLHYAHRKGLVHRDIKPGNILLDKSGKPFVADFGLALREQEIGKGPRHAGTPAYMSPEQARGEGHRVDGRSDIFSLGVVFYELLVGRQPFRADSLAELLEQVTTHEPRPLRQMDGGIPKELERICFKALSKRASERYMTAQDMADDLRHFLAEQKTSQPSSVSPSPTFTTPVVSSSSAPSAATAKTPTSDHQPIKIVPKGLRSFDAHDADFFFELLPGPRDRDGLPDSIRFWKTLIEETDVEQTFSVGLIYGPSGCGKSSLVKAGLLPRLSDAVIAVYVEATAGETETRLPNGLRKWCPSLPDNLCLTETLAALRRGQGIPVGKKVLIVLDQFEQWLHAKKEEENTELVQALRQCDGGRVQCIVMVRDDFWMAATRFMRDLEVRLVEAQNSAAVDLFPIRHAEKVLAAFGRAFGVLPENPGETSKDQKHFLEQTVSGLAQEGKIICVRLALFAEMMKGKAWTPATLKEVGGTEGVGGTFLEGTFSAATAPPEYRYHQKAARGVLKALLPESGSDIKGHMRSHTDLLAASGYANRPKDFDDLLRILDSEIRLITPTDPEGREGAEDSPSQTQPGQKYYQLTHDYLVHSLRDWLTRKQKETRRGRAELLLADRAAVWNARPENRQLPSLLQWLRIRGLTAKKNWTAPQRKMMGKASRYHAFRGFGVAILLALIGWGTYEGHGTLKAHALRDRLLDANINEVPTIVEDMRPYRRWLDTLLHDAYAQAEQDHNGRKQLHTSLALLPVDASQVKYLNDRLLSAEPGEVAVIRDALFPHRDQLVGELWTVVETPQKDKESQRLRAAAALAKYDAESAKWAKAQEAVVNDLVVVPAVYLSVWMDALRPVQAKLRPQLSVVYRNKVRRETERSLATDILADYATDDPPFLADLLMDAEDKQFAVLFPKLHSHQEKGQAALLAELDRKLQPRWSDLPLDPAWKPVDGALVQKIEAAHGLVHERFALCQTMPLAEFLTVAEQLRSSGFRPSRIRPYATANGVQVAAVWTRDGQDWRMSHGLSAGELQKRDAEARKESLHPVDACAYLSDGKELYAALWVKVSSGAPDTQRTVGLDAKQFQQRGQTLAKSGYLQATYTQMVSPNGTTRFCAIWSKAPGQTTAAETFSGIEADYGGDRGLQVDVQLSKPGPIPSSKDRYTQQLKEFEKVLQSKPNDVAARFQRALTCLNLGDNDKALADLTLVIKQSPNVPQAYQYRAIVHARLGKTKEANTDLSEFKKRDNNPSTGAYTDAVVAAYLGDDEQGMKRLEAAVTANAKESGFLYDAACAYAIASEAVVKKGPTRAKSYADRAIALLKQAIFEGYSDYLHMETDSDLDPIRQHAGYKELLKGAGLDRRYTAVWHPNPSLFSAERHGSGPAEHLASCQSLIARGYRPASLSVMEIAGGAKLTASVWHRPIVGEDDKERLAKRQANAAVALLKLNQSEKVWPLLKHSPDPRVRSYLIHRLSPLGADAGAIIERFDAEPDITIRRALLLSLGEYSEKDLSLATRQKMLPKLQDIYRTASDPGLHASAEWLLRQWKQEAWLKQVSNEWANNKELREKRLDSIRQGVNREKEKTPPQWYVNSQGQTMVVIPGPVEFLMGSPLTEKDRRSDERQHKQRIGRTFALAATPVTKEQFLRFQPSFSHSEFKRYPAPSCPIGGVRWFEAAAYCNWLSQQEGIPEDQWCYEIPEEPGDIWTWRFTNMKLKANYLSLTGYRLPTEAEWEYACRSDAATSRCYGETAELLTHYGWYFDNSPEQTQPLGTKKPNDWGLFDMHGNVWNWCHERYKIYPQSKINAIEDKEDIYSININDSRVLRGGSFIYLASYVRSSYRNYNGPAYRYYYFGFRPARTFTP